MSIHGADATERLLGEVATLQRGFDLPVQNRKPGEVPIFAANGPIGFHTGAKVSGPGVVTGRSGTLGKVHFVESDFWPLNTALWVKDFHGNDPRWVFRLLQTMRLEQFKRGVGVPTLNRNLVHEVLVRVPPLAEQQRIARILDAAEALRAKRRESIAQLEALVQATFLEMFGDPVENIRGWSVRSLQSLVHPERPITYGILKPGPDLSEGVPYVRVVDIRGEKILSYQLRRTSPKIASQYRRSTLQEGDLLMSIRGHVGRMAIAGKDVVGANITQDTARFALLGAQPEYVMRCLATEGMQQYMARRTKGAAVKGINLGDLKELPIPVAPAALQRQFTDVITKTVEQKRSMVAHLESLDTLFTSLQSRAFAGTL